MISINTYSLYIYIYMIVWSGVFFIVWGELSAVYVMLLHSSLSRSETQKTSTSGRPMLCFTETTIIDHFAYKQSYDVRPTKDTSTHTRVTVFTQVSSLIC